MDEAPPGGQAADRAPDPAASPRLLDELGRLAGAIRHLFGAQWRLFVAELALARGAVSWLLALGLVATVLGVGLGLTVLALIGVALARWLDSWLWALALLALLQGMLLAATIIAFRRVLRWLGLPATRGEIGAMMRRRASPPNAPAASDTDRTEP